jgi:hypothetical protein
MNESNREGNGKINYPEPFNAKFTREVGICQAVSSHATADKTVETMTCM